MRIDAKKAAEFLRENDDFLILMHSSPDGDTLGSGAALCRALLKLGKHAKTACPDDVPKRFDYLFSGIEKQDFEYKNIVCVDVADTKLLGDMRQLGEKAKLCIDHHVSNVEYAEMSFIESDSASACELIYAVIKELGAEFDKDICSCIYTGAATDTGCFKFSNVTPRTHQIAAEMIAGGADFVSINRAMFVVKTRGRITLEQEALKTIRFFAEGKVAVICASAQLIKSFSDIDNDDIGALANLPIEIEGVDVGVCVKEKKAGVFKASLRTSERVDAAEIGRIFGGGGHTRAAGCTLFVKTMEEAVEAVSKACAEACEGL